MPVLEVAGKRRYTPEDTEDTPVQFASIPFSITLADLTVKSSLRQPNRTSPLISQYRHLDN